MSISWDVTFPDGKHKLTFFHNTLSGNRSVKFDDKVVYSSGWMFKLVGPTKFTLKNGGKDHPCTVVIKPAGMAYSYELTVGGTTLARHSEAMRKISRTWRVTLGGAEHIVVLEKDKMSVCVDGDDVPIQDEFVDDGTEANFKIGPHECCIHTRSNGEKMEQVLYVGEEEIPEAFENRLVI
eukprot:m.453452 g.453452  ORF g.453452 m.453452 type:complete len:180 (-) comp20502_c0_seq1:697-1236(-)